MICLFALKDAFTISGTASSNDAPPSSAASSLPPRSSSASATVVLSTVLGSDSDWLEPSARNSNLLPVKANGLVRLRSPPCIGRGGGPPGASPREPLSPPPPPWARPHAPEPPPHPPPGEKQRNARGAPVAPP